MNFKTFGEINKFLVDNAGVSIGERRQIMNFIIDLVEGEQ